MSPVSCNMIEHFDNYTAYSSIFLQVRHKFYCERKLRDKTLDFRLWSWLDWRPYHLPHPKATGWALNSLNVCLETANTSLGTLPSPMASKLSAFRHIKVPEISNLRLECRTHHPYFQEENTWKRNQMTPISACTCRVSLDLLRNWHQAALALNVISYLNKPRKNDKRLPKMQQLNLWLQLIWKLMSRPMRESTASIGSPWNLQ